MSKEKEELTKGVEDAFSGWSISEQAKKEIIKKYAEKKEVKTQPPAQKATLKPQKMDIESLKEFMFTKAEKRVYDVLLNNKDLYNVTSPLSYQNIQDALKKAGKPVAIKTISRCIKSLLAKGLITIDTQPISTAGTRYKVTQIKEYLSQFLSNEEK